VSRFALLLRKDLLLLARSRPLLAVLVVYPLVLSLLVGGVLGGQGARPRVAFVNQDDIPAVVHIGDRSFDFGRIVRQAGKRVQLVNLTLPRARRALADGDVVAVIIVPRGFVAELSSLIASPQVVLLTNRNAYEERILRETQAFVYTLNSEVQTEYIRSNSHFLDVLVSGGTARALGRTYHVLGLEATRTRIQAVEAGLPADSPARDRLDSVTAFAEQASAALGLAHQALAATAHPIGLAQHSTGGRSYLLGSQVQSYALGISLAFVTLLLGAAVLTLERDENVLARLVRAGVRPGLLVAEKVALCALVGCALGLLLALGFGVAAEVSSSGAAWTRVPLLLVPLTAAGAAFGALGCLIGAAARDLRASSLVGVALVTPIVLVGLVPRQVSPLAADVSELLPFAPAARAFGASLFDAEPLSTALGGTGHLVLLTAALGVASVALFRRFARP
jgi:ABC-type multidrug transport system permease subunit